MECIIKKFLADHNIPEERATVLKAMLDTYVKNIVKEERDRIKVDLWHYMWHNYDVDISNDEYIDILYDKK